jgi:ubiquinone/menaquinone biosynthesis C-methylase UbiE
MNFHPVILVLIAVIAAVILISFGWRWASRIWSLPCPSLIGGVLESPFYGRIIGTEKTLARIGLQPGQRVLEIGPGPGRLLIHAARKVLPGGTVVGIDIQSRMLDRLKARVEAANITNLTAILGDATQPIVPEASFDVVFLAAALGEIPDRAKVLAQCFRALKPGGVLSISETQPDPHYQSKATVKRLAEAAGFQLQSIQGGMWLYTANFLKP